MSNQENISKETKKTRRKKSQRKAQQIKLAVIMIMVSVLVLSASTFAWYQMNKTANLTNMQFTADTLGNLLISDDGIDYKNTLDLSMSDDAAKAVLLPATTGDGESFKKPEYDENTGDTVIGLLPLEEVNIINGDDENFGSTYPVSGGEFHVYKKEFYIKSGVTLDPNKKYDLKFADGIMDNNVFTGGTYIKDAEDAGTGYTALNAIRVSFVFEVPSTEQNGDPEEAVWIYEPTTDADVASGTEAKLTEDINVDIDESFGPKANAYQNMTLVQNESGAFDADHVLCTITEGNPVKVTMYVWLEGNDTNCENEIALDTVVGQIQFEAVEKNN